MFTYVHSIIDSGLALSESSVLTIAQGFSMYPSDRMAVSSAQSMIPNMHDVLRSPILCKILYF